MEFPGLPNIILLGAYYLFYTYVIFDFLKNNSYPNLHRVVEKSHRPPNPRVKFQG